MRSVRTEVDEAILAKSYSDKSRKIAHYFITLRKSSEMTAKEFNIFKKKTLKYKMQNDQLFRRNNKNVSLRRVIDNEKKRFRILEQLHDESDHRDKEKIYRKVADRYY